MNTELSVIQDKEKTYMNEISDLIKRSDNEFVPPLSSRDSNSDNDLKNCTNNNNILDYIDGIANQDFIVVVDNASNKLVGFLSYVSKVVYDINCNYISTIIVERNYRNKGIAGLLYRELSSISDKPITVRTWSTNEGQIHLLQKLGYKYLKVLKNARGNGIDTIYFCSN